MSKFIIFWLLIILIGGGCAQKIQIKAIKSAEVSDEAIQNIGVLQFENDTVSQSIKIDSALSNATINGKKYFNVIDRAHLEKIMAEKKLNDSGLVDVLNNNSTNRGLQEVKTLVMGEVALNDLKQSRYLEERTDHETCIMTLRDKNGNKYCQKYRKYNIVCATNLYSLVTNIKFVRVSDSKVIFARSFSKSSKLTHCADDNNILPSKEVVNTALANEITENLISIITPSYIYFVAVLLDDEDIHFTKEQSKTFQTALELLKSGRTEKSNEILKKLNNDLQNKSYVVLYNLAITEEALGNLYESYELYKKAEDIALSKNEIVKELSVAMTRVKQNIIESEKVKKQLLIN